MINIFENAYFGKAYKTRCCGKALYAGKLPSTTLHRLLVEDTLDTFNYNEFGLYNPHGNSVYDIVSEWQEEINEKELDELANDEAQLYSVVKSKEWQEGFKAGYHKAKEYE